MLPADNDDLQGFENNDQTLVIAAGAEWFKLSGSALVTLETRIPLRRLLLALGELKMQAGMPAEVFIRTDRRTTFDYLFAPVTAYLRRAMREPI